MSKFKEGDKIKYKKEIPGCHGELNKEYEVILDPYGVPSVKNYVGYCYHANNWQLISPKERTIEDVQVGDEITDGEKYRIVVEVTKNLFASFNQWGRIEWGAKQTLVDAGWKIKQPETEKLQDMENEMDRQKWLEKGEKEGWLKEGRIVV